jgi:hypothetical protein
MGGMVLTSARFFVLLTLFAAARLDSSTSDGVFVGAWFVFVALLMPELRRSRLEASRRLFGPLWFRRLTAGLAVAGGVVCGVIMSLALLGT